ncbi:hypothetical protein HUT18_12715 [Streptomyces sp. NA04227]|uniref:hypothetical protein n=1 Tax=Streptomyces sp. NA04227 TaxID=2742136 RepID=UPI001590A4D2|nr:hypothetical protein [Streptomyces sp. NA04227]QKW07133.1 hypothetical protein HUT18_12715 [Streptomyces sp. NA04227]
MSSEKEDRRRRQEAERAEYEAVLALPTLGLRHHATITGRPGESRADVSIGPDGNLVALWTSARDRSALTSATLSPAGAKFPDPRAPHPVAARVTTYRPRPRTFAKLHELPLAHVHVQPLPEERVLVVGARCRWSPTGPDRNALVYEPDGTAAAEATLGDGIGRVLTTRTGHIWAGYFDEGIYGNYGWGGHDGPTPIGSDGLVRFSPDLKQDWRFPSHYKKPWGAVSSCPTLNIDGDTTWATYSTSPTGYPVVRVHDGTVTHWHNDTPARALAVAGTRAALLSSYGSHRAARPGRLTLGTLSDGAFHPTARYRLVLPDGSPVPPGTETFGHGADLHFVTDGDWYRVGLDDVPEGAGGS